MTIKNNATHTRLKQFIENKFLKHTTFIIVMLVTLCLALWARAFIGSVNNFNRGEAYFYKQQYIKAITFFARSMHWYTPFNPYIERSAEYLWEISEQSEQINDKKLSLIALETIRNSFYSSRNLFTPGTNWIERSESKIRNIIKNQKNIVLQGGDIEGEDTIHALRIEYNDPNLFWTTILEIGLFGWIGSVLGFIYSYFGSNKKRKSYIYTYWLWVLVAGINYGIWILGIVKA